jgi:protein subunit release factor B
MTAYRLPATDEELLAECDVETFRSSGPGGQNVNRRESAVRLVHRPTGITTTCQDERSQLRNKAGALERLRERLLRLGRKRKARIATGTPARAHQKRLREKKRHSEIKGLRRRPNPDG